MPVIAGTTLQPTLGAVLAIARDQHRVITTVQLLELGMTRHGIAHRVARGRLHPVFRGVFAIGTPDLTREGRWMAGVLACGEGAVLSHRTAAELWGLGKAGGEMAVTVPACRNPRREGIRVHRRDLTAAETAERNRIPVASPSLTLIDLAAERRPRALDDALATADRTDLIDPETLRTELDGIPRRPGSVALRDALDRYTLTLTDSELERRFLPIAREAGLPEPQTQVWLNGYRVDFFWPELGLIVETDGLRYHRTPAQQARDRKRDQAHIAAGLTPLRFPHSQVTYA